MKKTNVFGLLTLGLVALLIVICAMMAGVECYGQTTQPSTQPLTGSITGTLFYDTNGNGVWDAGEKPSPLWYLFIDTNGNGVRDPGEPFTRADANGIFTFGDLPAGTYSILTFPAAGWRNTTPFPRVTLSAGQHAIGIFIGEIQIPAPTAVIPNVATQPATQPTTQPASRPAMVLIPWEMTSRLISAQGGTVKLSPGDYEIAGVTMLRGNTTYDFTGVHFYSSKPGTQFEFSGDHTTVLNSGGAFDSIWPRTKPKGSNPKVGIVSFIISGKFHTLDHCTFMNVDTGWMLNPGASYIHVVAPHGTADMRGDLVFCGGGSDETLPRGPMWVTDLVSDDSEQEHGLRDSTPGFTGGWWKNCKWTCTNHKEPLALRKARYQHFIDCTINSDMGVYVGESGHPPDGSEPAYLDFSNCDLKGGGYWSFDMDCHDITIAGGSTEVRADLVRPDLCPRVFGSSSGSLGHSITYANHTRRIYGTGYNKTWFANFSGIPDAQVFIDLGGNQTVNQTQVNKDSI